MSAFGTGSAFGTTAGQNQTGGGIFGSSTTQQQTPQQPSSLFSGGQQGTSGAGLFGSTGTTGTGTSIFGTSTSNQPQQQQQSGGLFGSSTTTQPQQPGGGGAFGTSTTAQPQQSGGIFGTSTVNQPQQQQQQQQQQTGGLFSASTAIQPQQQTGGLFGVSTGTQPQQQSGGIFGASTATQPQQQQQQQQSGGLFSSTNQQSSGGLFGSTASTPGGGGLFGAKPATAPVQSIGSGSIFGGGGGSSIFGQSQTQGQQPQQQSGGLFGTSQPQQQSGGLFGSTQTQPQQQQSGAGLFGSTQQKPGGIFGSTFGSTAQPQQAQQQIGTPGIFGTSSQSAVSNAPAPLLGASSSMGTSMLGTSILGRNTLGLPVMNQSVTLRPTSSFLRHDNDPQAQHAKYLQKLNEIQAAWDPNSPDCRFQHYFYNLINPDDAGRYERPKEAINDAMWEKAVKENPDPSCLTPAPANSFDDLRIRVEAQAALANAHQGTLTDLTARLKSLNEKHTLSNTSRLQRAIAQHLRLTHRLLNFIQHLHLLIPTVRSSPIRPEEEQLRAKLEEIEDEVKRGRFRGKLNELWAVMGTIHAARERERGAVHIGDGEWKVVDEEGLAQLSNALSQQQTAIQYLLKTARQQRRDVNIMMGNGPSDVSDSDVLYNLPSMMQPNAR